jgi:hypothetical protein
MAAKRRVFVDSDHSVRKNVERSAVADAGFNCQVRKESFKNTLAKRQAKLPLQERSDFAFSYH